MNARETLKKLTLEQKCVLLSGAGEWQSHAFEAQGVKSFWMSDGPSGLRKQEGEGDHLGLNQSVKATCFPSAATMANTWNPELGYQVGVALGTEAAAQKVNVLLGPGLNVKRNPLCGRSFEYFSEDPYLAGKMAAGYVRGIQSTGVAACPKHFAVNSQEMRRMASDSIVDERTLRELYLTNFEIVVKESAPKTIMSSYNAVNGTYANENEHLLKDILRDTWGFDGTVITDWGGSNDHVAGVKAGSSLEMPAPGLGPARELLAAVKAGSLSEADIDARVLELLRLSRETNEALRKAPDQFDAEAHHAIARQAAEESLVLLKNEGGILPLQKGIRIAVIGDFAETPRYQGAGSSKVNPTRIDSLLMAARADAALEVTGYAKGYDRDGKADAQLLEEAVTMAGKADVVIFCLGLSEISESEGLDRSHIRILENQKAVLAAVAGANPNIVAVVSAGSAIETGWDRHCKAVLHTYLGGQAGAGAAVDAMVGRVNPSGKLAETLPVAYEDSPAAPYFPGIGHCAYYKEGLYVGYRYFATTGVEVAYPFGYGLSYTTFAYSDLQADASGAKVTITNTGSAAGQEIVQLYVGKKDAKIFRPAIELKSFAKVALQPGESKVVELPLDDKAYRYWNVKTNAWEIEGGAYQLLVGASCEDIRLQAEVTVAGTGAPNPYAGQKRASYESGRVHDVTDEEFAALLGHEIPSDQRKIDSNIAFCDLNHGRSPIFWLVWAVLTAIHKSSMKKGVPNLNVLFIYNMPLRALAKMTGGLIGKETVDGLVMEVKGFWIIGFLRALVGFAQNAIANAGLKKKLEEASRK